MSLLRITNHLIYIYLTIIKKISSIYFQFNIDIMTGLLTSRKMDWYPIHKPSFPPPCVFHFPLAFLLISFHSMFNVGCSMLDVHSFPLEPCLDSIAQGVMSFVQLQARGTVSPRDSSAFMSK
jgi:hypothetical protein